MVKVRTLALPALVGLAAVLTVVAPAVMRPASAAPFTFVSASTDGPWRTAQGSTWLAQSFVAPAGVSAVTSVSVMLRNANENNASPVNSSYSVEIRADNSGSPASVLATAVSNRSLGQWGQENETFTLGSPLALTAGATYHVVLTGSAGGTIGWKCSSPATTDVTPVPTFSARRSTDAGSTWTAVSGICAGQLFNTVVSGTGQLRPTLSAFPTVTAVLGDAPQTITPPTSNAAGTFTYTSSDPSIATVSGSFVTFTGVGTATITATFTPTDTANYISTTTTTTVTVAAAPTTTTTTTTTAGTTTTTTTTVPTTTSSTTTAFPRSTTTVAARLAPPVVRPSSTTSSTITSSTTTTTTTTTTSPTTTTIAPAAPSQTNAANDSLFGSGNSSPLAVVIQRSIGDPVGGTPVAVEAKGLAPGAPITVTVFSTPRELLQGTVAADGTFSAVVELPSDLGPGRHTIVAEVRQGDEPLNVAGALFVDEETVIAAMAQPAVLTDFAGPGDARLDRALTLDRAAYDPAAHPLTTSSIMVAAASMIALAGAGGIARASAGASTQGSGNSSTQGSGHDSERRQRNSRGKLANAVTKKLKSLNRDGEARGDASKWWRAPGTSTTDRFSATAPNVAGRWSAVVPRVLVDGAWLRAMFGSAGYLPWGVGAILGVVASTVDAASPLTPATGVLLAIVALGVLDAGAGASAWIAMTAVHLVAGETLESDVVGWADLRTILGFGILLATVPLLAHVIRPLRRQFVGNRTESWERALDYVIMPVFLAFAAGSMLKALNGLSGLEIVTGSDITSLRWVVFVSIIVRLAGEDITTVYFPRRMREVQPVKLVSPGKAPTTAGIVARSVIFLVVAEPFFGVTAVTVGAALLLAVPQVMKMWEDDLPNFPSLNKWLPRGLFRFLCLLVTGAWLSSTLIGGSDDPAIIESAFIWLLIPGVLVGVAELFARFGGDWPNVTVRRLLGAVVWLVAAGIVTGQVTIFG